MDSDEKPRSIRFPQWLWDEIDRDALRCKRSAVKQMEVVLTAYYREDVSQLDTDKLARLRPNGGAIAPTAKPQIQEGKLTHERKQKAR